MGVCICGGCGCGLCVCVCVCVCNVPTQAPSSVEQQEAKPNLLKNKLTQTGTGPGTPVDEVCIVGVCVFGV